MLGTFRGCRPWLHIVTVCFREIKRLTYFCVDSESLFKRLKGSAVQRVFRHIQNINIRLFAPVGCFFSEINRAYKPLFFYGDFKALAFAWREL